MQETYLKHLTVAIIATGAVVALVYRSDLATEAGMLLSGILGYVFKNGYAARGGGSGSGSGQSR